MIIIHFVSNPKRFSVQNYTNSDMYLLVSITINLFHWLGFVGKMTSISINLFSSRKIHLSSKLMKEYFMKKSHFISKLMIKIRSLLHHHQNMTFYFKIDETNFYNFHQNITFFFNIWWMHGFFWSSTHKIYFKNWWHQFLPFNLFIKTVGFITKLMNAF